MTLNGRKIRLDPDEGRAQRMFESYVIGAGGTVVESPRITQDAFRVAMERFLEYAARRLARGTLTSYRWALDRFALSVGERSVGQLTKADVLGHLDRYPDWSRSTRALQCGVIRVWWGWAVEEYGIAPLPRLRLPGIERRQVGTLDDLARWRERLPRWAQPWITVGLETGMRPGEQASLEWRDVNESSRSASVRGKTGRREVVLSALALETLRSLKDQSGPLFRNCRGNAWGSGSLGLLFRRYSDLTGIRIVPYSLRHLFTVRHIEAGTDIGTIARLLGHRDTTMVMRFYGTWSTATLRAAVDRLAS